MAEELSARTRTTVGDEELLYRATEGDEIWWEGDSIKVGPEAFRDSLNRPSVDRAMMRDYNPDLTRDYVWRDKSRPDLGIVALFSIQVRQISPLPKEDAKGRSCEGPQIDVEHVPMDDNHAHSEIFGTPHVSGKGLFRRLKIRLSQEAEKHQEQILFPRTGG